MKKIAVIAFLSAFVAIPALADNTGKAYVAADYGQVNYTNVSLFPNPGMLRIAGGYHFTPSLAAEIGYSYFGDSIIQGPGGTATLSAASFQVAVVSSLPLSKQFDLTVKLGMSNNSAKIVITPSNLSANTTKNSVLYGVGAQYRVNAQFSVRAQYEYYGSFDDSSSPTTAASTSIGVVFDF